MTFKGLTVVVNTGLLLVSLFEVNCAGAQENDGCAGAQGDLGHAEAWAGGAGAAQTGRGSEVWHSLLNCFAKTANLLLEAEDKLLLKDILNEMV